MRGLTPSIGGVGDKFQVFREEEEGPSEEGELRGVESAGLIVEHGTRLGSDVAVADFGVSLLGGNGGQWSESDREFTAQGGGDLDHGIEGEIGFAAEDLGNVGGRGSNFFGQGGAGEATGFHEGDEVLGKADGRAFRAVGVGGASLVGFGFEVGEVFHGRRKCRVSSDQCTVGRDCP